MSYCRVKHFLSEFYTPVDISYLQQLIKFISQQYQQVITLRSVSPRLSSLDHIFNIKRPIFYCRLHLYSTLVVEIQLRSSYVVPYLFTCLGYPCIVPSDIIIHNAVLAYYTTVRRRKIFQHSYSTIEMLDRSCKCHLASTPLCIRYRVRGQAITSHVLASNFTQTKPQKQACTCCTSCT